MDKVTLSKQQGCSSHPLDHPCCLFGPSTDRWKGRVLEPESTPRSRRPRRDDAPRRERVNARFNELEYATLMTAAASAGMSVTAYVATAAVAVAREEVSPAPVEFKERMRALSDARVAVNRIGTNLNQIAAVLNSEGEETPERMTAVLERVERAVRSLDEATIAVMEGRA